VRALVIDHGGVLTDGPEMLELVRRVRGAGASTALVTDAHVLPDGCAGLFDVTVLGPQLGVRKPDPEIYRRTAALLGVLPQECVVVDDLARNVRGARAAGAVVVLHRDPASTIAELAILFDLPGNGSGPGADAPGPGSA
jgi:beta-phosphoglucomutase-like phosphatase (HAD superfamily)